MQELHDFAVSLVERINRKYSSESYQPVVWLERSVPLYEKIALYSVADVAVVAATRDGMNLVPYEYIVSRQGQPVRGRNSHLVSASVHGLKCFAALGSMLSGEGMLDCNMPLECSILSG